MRRWHKVEAMDGDTYIINLNHVVRVRLLDHRLQITLATGERLILKEGLESLLDKLENAD